MEWTMMLKLYGERNWRNIPMNRQIWQCSKESCGSKRAVLPEMMIMK
jgi:hypothetical protein